jgi:hypothetical protein
MNRNIVPDDRALHHSDDSSMASLMSKGSLREGYPSMLWRMRSTMSLVVGIADDAGERF